MPLSASQPAMLMRETVSYPMATYLITGIAGFIGSSLAHALVEQGEQVRGIDNLASGRLENLAGLRSAIDFRQADLLDLNALRDACTGVEFVLHQAALPSVPRSVKNPLASHQANIDGTLNLLLAARDAAVRRIVYAASSSAYGNQPTQLRQEDMIPQPLSPYAVQKLTGEYYLRSFCTVYGMEGISLRYFNIFGPRQAADSPYAGVIPRFISNMLAGHAPTIFGDGSTSRDFTFVTNAVDANLLACRAPKALATGRVFNIATAQSHTLNDLYNTLADILHFKGTPSYAEARIGDVQHSLASIDRASSELGYQPLTDFRAGLERTVDWYLANAPASPASGWKAEA